MRENHQVIRVDDTIEPMVEKLASLEREVSSEKGEFSLFGLFLREDSNDRWDLLVSAPWLEANERDGLRYLAGEIQSRLDVKEQVSLSRVVILEKGNPVLAAIHKMVGVSHGRAEVQDSVVSGLEFRRGYIITSGKD